jgi:sugar transferase (PEP-CTERM/EpsH1 system associated)
MKVLFLTHRLPFAPNRGDRIRAYHMLRHLRGRASVDLVSLVHDEDEASAVADVPADHVTVVGATPWRNRVKSAARLLTSTPLTHTLLDAPRLAHVVNERVRLTNPDVIVGYCSGMARLALARALHDVPFVLDMVDVDSEKWRSLSGTTPPPLGWIYAREARCLRRFETVIVRHARATLVVNERERDTLLEIVPGAEIRIVPNGIDLDGFRHPSAERPPSPQQVVMCGVMNYQPNEEAAIRLVRRIWPDVRAALPGARLTIVGSNPTARLMSAVTAGSGVDITGSVPDVRPYLWGSSVSVAMLATARGIQNKVLEALAADLPVVISPAVAEGLPASTMAGCLVAADDRQAAAAIVRLLQLEAGKARSLARRADLSELGWDAQLEHLVPILNAAARRATTGAWVA